ncbi:hypothetical protein LXL04_003985 [Taraxacum kok-saghyz]
MIYEYFFTKFHRDEIYNNNGRVVSFRAIFESMFSRTQIHAGVLDVWSDYLKEQEKERDVVNSPLRLFMKPEISFSVENEHLDEERHYQFFKENFRLAVHDDNDLVVLKDVDIVFLPVIRSQHIYLFVFNLAKPAYEGIDNSADEAEFLDKYGKVFIPLKVFFLRYLFDIGHPKAFDMASEELTPRPSKWKAGFTKKGTHQQKLLERLREKYAATMLYSRMCYQRDVILSQAREYCQKTDANVLSGDRFKAQFEITGRLLTFG